MKTIDIMTVMEQIAPTDIAENWDNSGLLIGESEKNVKKIMLALDVSSNVIDEAILQNIDLIISHHPIIFENLKKITDESFLGANLLKLIKNNISVYTAHTNLDKAPGAASDTIADCLSLTNIEFLEKSYKKLYKFVVFVPNENLETVKLELFKYAGSLGNYKNCSFDSSGSGSFEALENARPYVGEIGIIEHVDETRIEALVEQKNIKSLLAAIRAVHPYEEPAFDIYPLFESYEDDFGIGRIGQAKKEKSIEEISEILKAKLNKSALIFVRSAKQKFKNIAIVNGSGASFISLAKQKNADLLITSDIKYHDAMLAKELGIALIDAGHFDTELYFLDFLHKKLSVDLEKHNVEIIKAKCEKNPLEFI